MIRSVLVGCGRWGRRLLAAIRDHGAFEVVAVADSDATARSIAGPYAVASLEQALERAPALVFVATPPALHATHALRAMRVGCDVFVEKPMSLRSDAARAMCRQARNSGAVAMVGHLVLFHSQVSALVEAARRGQIGELRKWESRRESSSGAADPLWTLAPHDLAIVRALDRSDVEETELHTTPDGKEIALRFASGLRARLSLSTHAPQGVRSSKLIGTQGMLFADELMPSAVSPLRAELDHLAMCVQHRLTPMTSFEEASWIVSTLERVQVTAERVPLAVR